MKRQLISANLFDTEFEKVHELAKNLNWNPTETTSFLVRWALKNLDASKAKDEFYETLVDSQMNEYQKTPEGKKYMKDIADKAIEDYKNGLRSSPSA
jgi:hypothetical protein